MNPPSGDALTDHKTGATQLVLWAQLDERESRVPHDLNLAAFSLVSLAQQCAQQGIKVRLETRPGLRLMLAAAKAALATIEDELLLSYERQREEAAEANARWLRLTQDE